jgi:hypothetical protein
VQQSGVKHSRYLGAIPSFAALAARALQADGDGACTGLIFAGGASSLAASMQFLTRAHEAGPLLVNPLQFPATLNSAAGTIVAAAVNAHAFAFVCGHDRLAFFEALWRAARCIDQGFAERVLVVTASSGEAETERARCNAGLRRPSLDVAIGVALSGAEADAKLQLLDVAVDRPFPNETATYEASFAGDDVACELDTPLNDGEAYGAAGAVLLAAAAERHAATNPPASERFSIGVRTRSRTAYAAFECCASGGRDVNRVEVQP